MNAQSGVLIRSICCVGWEAVLYVKSYILLFLIIVFTVIYLMFLQTICP